VEEKALGAKRYVIITPVRDEEAYIKKTIESVLSQTILPLRWVIVDDGSTDNTVKIANDYAGAHRWIQLILRENRGFRKPGLGVMEAFYEGLSSLGSREWDFIVKMDGDLSFDHDYFERCFEEFKNDRKLGIAGGMIYHVNKGSLHIENHPLFHVRGATKIYRRECWDAIGGLIKATGWDTIDEVKASMLGWRTRSFPELKVIHYRLTGTANGIWRNYVKNGRANYISGYHPLFMLLKCMKRTFQKPYLIGAIALTYGFFGGYLTRSDQIKDRQLINYIRQQQIRKMALKDSIWK
jgi:biofilm PGA synthesis N-glycosyltransferase PgaC